MQQSRDDQTEAAFLQFYRFLYSFGRLWDKLEQVGEKQGIVLRQRELISIVESYRAPRSFCATRSTLFLSSLIESFIINQDSYAFDFLRRNGLTNSLSSGLSFEISKVGSSQVELMERILRRDLLLLHSISNLINAFRMMEKEVKSEKDAKILEKFYQLNLAVFPDVQEPVSESANKTRSEANGSLILCSML